MQDKVYDSLEHALFRSLRSNTFSTCQHTFLLGRGCHSSMELDLLNEVGIDQLSYFSLDGQFLFIAHGPFLWMMGLSKGLILNSWVMNEVVMPNMSLGLQANNSLKFFISSNMDLDCSWCSVMPIFTTLYGPSISTSTRYSIEVE